MDLFLKILNMNFSATWLIFAVIFVRFLLKKSPKFISAALWGLVAFRLIFPWSIKSVVSLIPSAKPIPEDIVYSPSVTVQSFALEADSALMNFWTGTLRLKSNQSDLTLNGKLSFTSPQYIADRMGVTEIKNIIPGAVKSVPLNMTGDMVGQQVKLKVELDNGEVVDLTTRLSRQ